VASPLRSGGIGKVFVSRDLASGVPSSARPIEAHSPSDYISGKLANAEVVGKGMSFQPNQGIIDAHSELNRSHPGCLVNHASALGEAG
jgi:hypothetical protein